ncbi:MAG: hypothetical protein HOA60_02800 [Rhodospirillales bacterium]|nr:hypothetical protein [Rhodospirillales bacterium]
MARRGSRREKQERSAGLAQMPFRPLKNPYSPIEILSQDQVEAIHHASLRILKEIILHW